MLKNPSSSVVSVEVRILSLYPAPLEALDLLSKWFVLSFCVCKFSSCFSRVLTFFFFCRFNNSPLSVNISTSEFTLLASPPKVNPCFCVLNFPSRYLLFSWYIFLSRLARMRRTWWERVSCVCSCSPGKPGKLLWSSLPLITNPPQPSSSSGTRLIIRV